MSRDDAPLLDILRYSERALRAAHGRHLEELERDEALQSLLIHPLLVIGEAVKGLSAEFCERHNQIPWTQIAGMRDRLIHSYQRTDWEVVWKAVTEDLPKLAEFARSQGIKG